MKILSIEFTMNHIYIYEQSCGKKEVSVEKKYKLDMPTNAYFNRMLINNDRRISDAIKNCVAENKVKTKKVVLTIASTDCMVEDISILNGNKKQIEGMIEQELRKRHKLNADYLYDYIVVGPDPLKEGFLSVQVTLCVKAMIQNAYDIIKKAGLTPYKIVFVNHAMEEIAKLYQLTDAKESSVIACVNQDEAHYLYVGHGQEPYYRYSKLKTEQKAEENFFILSNINQRDEDIDFDEVLERKVTEDLTRMMRFHSQRNPGKEIANIYLYGCYDKQDRLADYLENSLNIPIKPISLQNEILNIRFSINEEEHSYNGVVAAFSLLKDRERLYDFFGKLEEVQSLGKDKLLFLPSAISLLIFIIILLVSLDTRTEARKLTKEAEELTALLSSEEILEAYAEKNKLIEMCSAYTRYNNQVAEAIELLETMPRFESEMFKSIDAKKPTGTMITGYVLNVGTLELGCYSADQYAPAEFAKILEESGEYKEVSYGGFKKNPGIMGEEIYSFTITIKMW